MITILITIVLVGLFLWVVETYVPMAPPIRVVLYVVAVLLLIVWLLRVLRIDPVLP